MKAGQRQQVGSERFKSALSLLHPQPHGYHILLCQAGRHHSAPHCGLGMDLQMGRTVDCSPLPTVTVSLPLLSPTPELSHLENKLCPYLLTCHS